MKLEYPAVLRVVSVRYVVPGELVGLISEVIVESMGLCPSVSVGQATNSAIGIQVSMSASLWFRSTGLMGHGVPGLATGMTGNVGSGLVPGLKGYGVSNRLPNEEKQKRDEIYGQVTVNLLKLNTTNP